jgi:hypothetical protein
LPWNEARPLEVELANGLDMDQGRTTMTLRALHDGNELPVLAEWLDATGNRLHSGWQRRADGWSKLQTDPRTGTRCAAYDQTGDRHAYGLSVYRLRLEK